MSIVGNTFGSGKGELRQSYYIERLNQLENLSEEMSKLMGELQTRANAILSNAPPSTSMENKKVESEPACELDERLKNLVEQFTMRRNDLTMIISRICL